MFHSSCDPLFCCSVVPLFFERKNLELDADSEVAREYEMDIDSQFVPLRVYTLDVDYTAVDVQVMRLCLQRTC